MVAAGFYEDPSHRFVQRYFDGDQWTAWVIDQTGAEIIDQSWPEMPAVQVPASSPEATIPEPALATAAAPLPETVPVSAPAVMVPKTPAKGEFTQQAKGALKRLKIAEAEHNKNVSAAEIQVAQAKIDHQKRLEKVDHEIQQAKDILSGTLGTYGSVRLYGDRVVRGNHTLRLRNGVEASVNTSGSKYTTSDVHGTSGGFGLGRAVVGGAIAGPLGAAVGGATKKGKVETTTTVHDERKLFITIHNSDGYITEQGSPDSEASARSFVAEIMNAVASYNKRVGQSASALEAANKHRDHAASDTQAIDNANTFLEATQADTAQVNEAKAALDVVISTGTVEQQAQWTKKAQRVQENSLANKRRTSEQTQLKVANAQQASTRGVAHGAIIQRKEINAITYLVLAILLGWLGVHRFYRGSAGMGVLYLLTGGLCGVGWIVDIIVAIIYLTKAGPRHEIHFVNKKYAPIY